MTTRGGGRETGPRFLMQDSLGLLLAMLLSALFALYPVAAFSVLCVLLAAALAWLEWCRKHPTTEAPLDLTKREDAMCHPGYIAGLDAIIDDYGGLSHPWRPA